MLLLWMPKNAFNCCFKEHLLLSAVAKIYDLTTTIINISTILPRYSSAYTGNVNKVSTRVYHDLSYTGKYQHIPYIVSRYISTFTLYLTRAHFSWMQGEAPTSDLF